MKVKYPIVFTKTGKGWRKSEIEAVLRYKNGDLLVTSRLKKCHLKHGDFSVTGTPVNGYFEKDGEKIRITNIAGCKNGRLMKYCPACKKVKRLSKFDLSGRHTGEQRDQSNCSKCRSKYRKK